MQTWLIIVVVIAAVLAVALLLFLFALLSDKIAFGRRVDKNPALKYFTAEDFNLTARPVSLEGGLKGALYSDNSVEGRDGVVVFCHGMGPGHVAYTTEIAYFCNLGYDVLAVDSRGCNMSEGKNIKGMYCGVKTAVEAVDYARSLSENIYLVGHSWGAYSALCASAERKVNAVVAISAPDTPSKTVRNAAADTLSKPFAYILQPFWWLVNAFRFGAKGNKGAVRCAQINNTPTLLVHGDKDGVINKSGAAYYRAEGENIEKLLVKGKAHNPYNTENAEKLLAELSSRLAKGCKDFSDFDFKAVTEEDAEVMRAIAEFIEKH